MGMVMFGNGVAGLGSNAVRAASLLIWPADDAHPNNLFISALFNFVFAVVFFVICTILVLAMGKNPYAAYYLNGGNPR